MASGVEAWTSAVQQLVSWVGAEKALLFSPTEHADRLPAVPLHLDPVILREYAEHWRDLDIWTQRLDAARALEQPGVVHGEQFVPHREFTSSAVYNDCLGRSGVGKLLVSAVLPRGNARGLPMMVCSLYRGAEDGDFTAGEQQRFAAVVPHLVQSLESYWLWRNADAWQQLWRGALDSVGAAVILLDDREQVLMRTPQAADLMRDCPLLSIHASRLVALGNRANLTLVTAAQQAAREQRPLTVRLLDERGKPQLILSLAPVPDALRLSLGVSGVRTLALLRPVDAGNADSTGLLARTFRLTPAERRVTELLVQGLGPAAIANQVGASVATVRSHLKRIYAKTETHGQRELLTLAARLGAS